MRTNIEIDEKLIAEAMRASGATTEREAIEIAIRALLQLERQKAALKLRGKINWVGDLDAMRLDA